MIPFDSILWKYIVIVKFISLFCAQERLFESKNCVFILAWCELIFLYTLESRIIGGVGIIGGLDIVIIINNRGGWTGLKK